MKTKRIFKLRLQIRHMPERNFCNVRQVFYSRSPKVVSATFLLVGFVSLKESTCKTRKNAFDFTSKGLLLLEINNIKRFRYSNIMTSSNAQARNMRHILLNNLGSKCSLVMKFGRFMQYYKKYIYIKKFYEKSGLETSSGSF